MKNYPKTYEDVFAPNVKLHKAPKGTQKCNLDLVSIHLDRMGIAAYQNKIQSALRKFELDFFDNVIKVFWLFKQFKYKGRPWDSGKHGCEFDMAFSYFIKGMIGFNPRVVMRHIVTRIIISYCEDFFPNFTDGNPFEQEYKYPYKYITLGHLGLVYLMSERLDLLAEAEKGQMNISQFLDYVINYIMCYNDEHGEVYYYKIAENGISTIQIMPDYYAKVKACHFR